MFVRRRWAFFFGEGQEIFAFDAEGLIETFVMPIHMVAHMVAHMI